MNYSILEQAMNLVNLSIGTSPKEEEKYLTQAQDLLLEYLKNYPKDIQAWLLLARLECNPPFYDPEKIIKYTETILSYDKGNIYALLLLSYADYYLMGSQNDNLIDKLSQVESKNLDLLSLIEIAKARFWEFRNKEEYEKCLLKSIQFCKSHVTNYVMLGKFYINQERFNEGLYLIKQALFNRNRIFMLKDNEIYNPADINNLLKDFFINAEGIDDQLRALVNKYEE